MNQQEINNLLEKVIENSKYKNKLPQEKQALKRKLVQRYLSDFNEAALDMMDKEKRGEFSKILATENQSEIDKYISENMSDLISLAEKAGQKFSSETNLLLKV